MAASKAPKDSKRSRNSSTHQARKPTSKSNQRQPASSKGAGKSRRRTRGFLCTDSGNAELLAEVHGDRLRYDHTRKRWLVWQGHWWGPDEIGSVRNLAKGIARLRLKEAVNLLEANWAVRSESHAKITAALDLAQSLPPIADSGKNWDSDPMLLGVANGVVDLRTGKLRPGRPEDRITMHINIVFDPAAKCPRWERFLDEVFADDKELIGFVKRAVGYSLTGSTEEQVLFLLFGEGANGKTTFLETIHFVLGDYGFNLPFSAFEIQSRAAIPNDVAALVGRRFVSANETAESTRLNESRIKALTGNDKITARFLHKEFFEFNPRAKFWLAFNHKPDIRDDSHGLWRRLRLIPFRVQFAEGKRDPNLLDALKHEGSGILTWAVEGCREWHRQGLGVPELVTKATEAYREESDPLDEFLQEVCVIGTGERVAAGDIWRAYIQYAADNAEKYPLDRKAFAERLRKRGFERRQIGHAKTYTWLGVGLRNPPPLSFLADPVRASADVKNYFVPKIEQTMN